MTLDISVVIPTFNQDPKYLTQAIESVLCQSFPKEKYEILVVDDGSTRILPDPVIERFHDEKNLRLIKKNHGGTGHTLNAGIMQMRGKYFKWLSSDDELVENSLEIFMSQSPSERKILYGDWLKIDENSGAFGVQYEPAFESVEAAERYLWCQFFGNATASLIPKSAFFKVGLFDSLPYFEDYDWWLRAMFLHNYSFEHVNKIVAKYRYHSSQFTMNIEAHPLDKALVNWKIKRRVYLAMDEAKRSNVNPIPSLAFLSKRLLFIKGAMTYNKIIESANVASKKKLAKIPALLYSILQ